jgi:hypothetical protein
MPSDSREAASARCWSPCCASDSPPCPMPAGVIARWSGTTGANFLPNAGRGKPVYTFPANGREPTLATPLTPVVEYWVGANLDPALGGPPPRHGVRSSRPPRSCEGLALLRFQVGGAESGDFRAEGAAAPISLLCPVPPIPSPTQPQACQYGESRKLLARRAAAPAPRISKLSRSHWSSREGTSGIWMSYQTTGRPVELLLAASAFLPARF